MTLESRVWKLISFFLFCSFFENVLPFLFLFFSYEEHAQLIKWHFFCHRASHSWPIYVIAFSATAGIFAQLRWRSVMFLFFLCKSWKYFQYFIFYVSKNIIGTCFHSIFIFKNEHIGWKCYRTPPIEGKSIKHTQTIAHSNIHTSHLEIMTLVLQVLASTQCTYCH